eukprot:3582289-Ditylum_brightwellii.AAC.1
MMIVVLRITIRKVAGVSCFATSTGALKHWCTGALKCSKSGSRVTVGHCNGSRLCGVMGCFAMLSLLYNYHWKAVW